jgi:hypothetical protein
VIKLLWQDDDISNNVIKELPCAFFPMADLLRKNIKVNFPSPPTERYSGIVYSG